MEPVLLPVPVAEALSVWIDSHDDAAPGLIEGLYVVGSVALGDWTPHSDIDVVAVVAADQSDPDPAPAMSEPPGWRHLAHRNGCGCFCDERTARMADFRSSLGACGWRSQPARRATTSANSRTVSSMIFDTGSIDSMRPAT